MIAVILIILIIFLGIYFFKRNVLFSKAESDLSKLSPNEKAEALSQLEKAKEGKLDAIYYIATVYRVELENPEMSFKWMKKAANKEYGVAQYWLGKYYIEGYYNSVDRTNYWLGIRYLTFAAQRGQRGAIIYLTTKLDFSEDELREIYKVPDICFIDYCPRDAR